MKKHRCRCFALVGLFCSYAMMSAAEVRRVEVLTSERFTGSDLAQLPSLTTRPLSVDGDNLIVGAGGSKHERLFQIPLVPAGTFDELFQQMHVTFELTETRPDGSPIDHDIYVAVFDGESFVGFGREDDGGWQGSIINGDGSGPSENQQVIVPSSGFSSTLSGAIFLSARTTKVAGRIGSRFGEGDVFGSGRLDRTRDLSLLVLLGDTNETYSIESLAYSVISTPEPSTLVLLALAFGSAGLGRRVSRACRPSSS